MNCSFLCNPRHGILDEFACQDHDCSEKGAPSACCDGSFRSSVYVTDPSDCVNVGPGKNFQALTYADPASYCNWTDANAALRWDAKIGPLHLPQTTVSKLKSYHPTSFGLLRCHNQVRCRRTQEQLSLRCRWR